MTTLRSFEQQLARASPEQQVAFIWSVCSGLHISTVALLYLAESIGDNQVCAAIEALARDPGQPDVGFNPPAGASADDGRLVTATICEVWGIRPSLLAQTASDVLHANPADYAMVRTGGCVDDGFVAQDACPVLQQPGDGMPPVINRYAAQAAVARLFEPVLASPREPIDELIAIYHWSRHRMRRSRRTVFAQLAALLEMREDELGDLLMCMVRAERTPANCFPAECTARDVGRRACVLRFCQATSLSLEELSDFRRRPVRAHRPPPDVDSPPETYSSPDCIPTVSAAAGPGTKSASGRPISKRRRHVVLSAGIMVSALVWLMTTAAA